MSFKDINMGQWFHFEFLEADLQDDPEQLEFEKNFAQVWKEIQKLAQDCLNRVGAKPSDDAVLLDSLDEFYKAWKRNDKASDTEIRDQVYEFLREVLKQSGTKLNQLDAFNDVIFGHVGVKIYSQSEMSKNINDKEIQTVVDWVELCLEKHGEAELPGFMGIKLFRRKEGNGLPPEYLISNSFSLKLKDISRSEEMDLNKINDKLTPPSEAQMEAAKKLSIALVDALLQGTFPIKVKGLGIFQAEELPGYEGRNPRTGEMIPVPGRKIAVFRMDRGLKEKITKILIPL